MVTPTTSKITLEDRTSAHFLLWMNRHKDEFGESGKQAICEAAEFVSQCNDRIAEIIAENRDNEATHTEASSFKNQRSCANLSYICRNQLLKNINPHVSIERLNDDEADDFILRPIALLDIAYRDLQDLNGKMPMNDAEFRRYRRTIKCIHQFFTRIYRGMGDEQVIALNDAMENMESGIKKDYDVLYYTIMNSMNNYIQDTNLRMWESKLCVIHVCVDLPFLYISRKLKATHTTLQMASDNVVRLMRYIATQDSGTDEKITLNNDKQVEAAMRIFQNRFWQIKLT